MQRRLELVSFARCSGAYLVEDDYDSEFRYDGLPSRSLYELDGGNVVYIGTFSKIMFPSMRLGYMVLPYPLLSRCRELKRLCGHHSNSVYQLALARFIEDGELERHIRRMKKAYLGRRNFLLERLDADFPGNRSVGGACAGMHLTAGFGGITFTPEIVSRAREEGLYLSPVESHAIVKGKHANQLILGYAHLDVPQLEEGLTKLKKIIC